MSFVPGPLSFVKTRTALTKDNGRRTKDKEAMNQALVQDVVTEVMRRLGNRVPGDDGGVRAGEDSPANDAKRREAERRPHRIGVPVGRGGVFTDIDQCVAAA